MLLPIPLGRLPPPFPCLHPVCPRARDWFCGSAGGHRQRAAGRIQEPCLSGAHHLTQHGAYAGIRNGGNHKGTAAAAGTGGEGRPAGSRPAQWRNSQRCSGHGLDFPTQDPVPFPWLDIVNGKLKPAATAMASVPAPMPPAGGGSRPGGGSATAAAAKPAGGKLHKILKPFKFQVLRTM